MITRQEPEKTGSSGTRRPLPVVIVLMLATAALLWGASALDWGVRRYGTPFTGEKTFTATGAMVRPELGPLALATLAAIAAVLATGGWMRRLIGMLVVAEGGLLGWRVVDWYLRGRPLPMGEVPAGSTPLGPASVSPFGPLLVVAAALVLVTAGLVAALYARRMPAMGAKYSAPKAAKQESRDPDRRLWDALDQGEDPTESADPQQRP
ncbi:putative membrane protein (TIGR02234 family) [Saccharopolyspora lacisalsi]|uniref:Putative membrane protein (TIGR02234 family) n=1 Tax=Halosaccharopolyspora lacisalsi TaxID=1000566 RepID=A0A839E4H4_9PSEU|nr:Trp biosynthesis-associated membrane protein [Halosaccharopolyspora lacisalsi]MBA8825818.1 putative membrane protein (TIGR02234 family) [Halosaccharopolyspora lacisalsi]